MAQIETEHSISEILACHFCGISFNDIEPANISAVNSMLMDYLGVALRGSTTGSGKIAGKFAAANGGKPESSVIGTDYCVPAADAAFGNAIAAHSIEMDDVDKEALFHFSPPVVSAALAVGEAVGCSGKELLTAIFCGCEMMERLSRAGNPALRNRGYHTTAVTGVFGATVAAGKLLKLNEEALVNALGLAGAQASGLMEMYGNSMQKRFNPGPAARNGVVSASLAALGFTGTEYIFEGKRGFFNAFAGEANLEFLKPRSKQEYQLEVEFKAYACARPIHPAIDAALVLREKLYPHLEEIETIRVYRHPMWAHYHTNSQPKSYHEAQVSLEYSVAVSLVEGDAFFDQYLLVENMSEKVRQLMGKVCIIPDSDMPSTVGCRVEIICSDGETIAHQVDYPKGSIQVPLSREEHIAKVRKLAGKVLAEKELDDLLQLVAQVETLPDLRGFRKCVAVKGGC